MTMKMAASPPKEAMAMRQCFTTPLVEQGWTSVLCGLLETSWVVAVGAGVDLVVGTGNRLGTRRMMIPVVLVDASEVEVEVEESFKAAVVGDSLVDLSSVVAGSCDEEVWVLERDVVGS